MQALVGFLQLAKQEMHSSIYWHS